MQYASLKGCYSWGDGRKALACVGKQKVPAYRERNKYLI